MTRIIVICLGFLLLSPLLPSQNTEPEPQTMQAVLLEVRGLRHDLQAAAIAARRAQILIYRLHEQRQAVEQASERAENAKSTLEQMQTQLRYEADQLKQAEEMRERGENDANQKQVDNWIAQIKARMEMGSTGMPEQQSRRIEAETDLRTEREKLERLESELEQLTKDLDGASPEAVRNGRN